MPISFLSFPPRICHTHDFVVPDYALRDHAIELFHGGDPLGALHQALRVLLPGIAIDDLRTAPVTFVHGTARIQLSLDGEDFVATSEIAKLPEQAKSTAALRHMLTEVSSTGQLYQPRLIGNSIFLQYRETLALLHPAKLLEAVKKLALDADRNDHWMIKRFGIEPGNRQPVSALSALEQAAAGEFWTAHWQSVESLLNEVRRHRSTLLLNSVCTIALCLPQYQLPLYGEVRRALQEDESLCLDFDADPETRVAALARTIKAMRAISPELLAGSLGHVVHAIPPLTTAWPALIGSIFDRDQWSSFNKARSAGRTLEAALILVGGLIALLSRYHWNEPLASRLRQGLELAHQRPFREVAEVLGAFLADLCHEYGEMHEVDEDDFEPHALTP